MTRFSRVGFIDDGLDTHKILLFLQPGKLFPSPRSLHLILIVSDRVFAGKSARGREDADPGVAQVFSLERNAAVKGIGGYLQSAAGSRTGLGFGFRSRAELNVSLPSSEAINTQSFNGPRTATRT